MIIGISGKIGSGKDTIGRIIQFLTDSTINTSMSCKEFLQARNNSLLADEKFEIKKFADTLKDIVCLLINCTREQLENEEFKNTELGEEWWVFKFPNNQISIYKKDVPDFWQKYLIKLTPRLLLQLIGTECGRNIIHPDIWVNSLFNKYNYRKYIYMCDRCMDSDVNLIQISNKWVCADCKDKGNEEDITKVETEKGSKWIITDIRFPNEAKAVKDREGILIRVNRIEKGKTYFINSRYDEIKKNIEVIADYDIKGYDDLVFIDAKGLVYRQVDYKISTTNEHISEIALDDYKDWDYVIDNNSTIESLIEQVKQILIKEKIL